MFLLKKSRHILFSFLIILVIFTAFEGFAQIFLRLKLKEQYPYRYQHLKNLIHAEGWHDRFMRSPYFGYVCDRNKIGDAFNDLCNNHGFSDKKDFPYRKKNPDEIVIGIFGGSVAENLGDYILRNQESHKEMIKVTLHNRPVTFLNFALGGYKFWQTFNVMAYYLDTLDYVVVLDGQNELTSWPHPRFSFDYPYLSVKFFDQSQIMQWLTRAFNLITGLQVRLIKILNNNKFLRKSAFCYIFAHGLTLLKNTSSNHIVEWQKSSNLEKDNLDLSLHRWKTIIQYSQTLVNGVGKKYFHFMQPSPYSSDLKPMNDTELRATLKKEPLNTPNWRYAEVAQRNQFYDKNIQPLISSSSNLINIFDHEPRQVYLDDCCHVNELGNFILFETILKKVSLSIKKP